MVIVIVGWADGGHSSGCDDGCGTGTSSIGGRASSIVCNTSFVWFVFNAGK